MMAHNDLQAHTPCLVGSSSMQLAVEPEASAMMIELITFSSLKLHLNIWSYIQIAVKINLKKTPIYASTQRIQFSLTMETYSSLFGYSSTEFSVIPILHSQSQHKAPAKHQRNISNTKIILHSYADKMIFKGTTVIFNTDVPVMKDSGRLHVPLFTFNRTIIHCTCCVPEEDLGLNSRLAQAKRRLMAVYCITFFFIHQFLK